MNRVILGMLLIAGLGARLVASQPDKPSDYQHSTTQQKAPIRLSGNPQNKPGDSAQKADDDAPHWYTAIKRPEWCLVAIAFLTALVIGWQSCETRKAAEAAQKNIGLVVSKERARLTVEIDPLELWSSDDIWKVGLKVVNHGETKAFVRRAIFLPLIESNEWLPEGKELHYVTMKIPPVIYPSPEGVRCDGPIQEGIQLHATCWDIGVQTAKSVYASHGKLFVVGVIDYDDVFDNEWRVLFYKVWNPMFVTDGLPTYAEWRSDGTSAVNGEHRRQKRGPKDKPESFAVFPPN